MKEDEQTTTQPVASEETEVGTSEQTLESSVQGQSEQVEEASLIPDKFIGKSAADIATAYKEVEQDRGRMSSELGSIRKEKEDLEEKYRQLERQSMQYQATPVQTPPQVPVQAQTDPLAAFESKWEEDPKAAIREAFRQQQETLQASTQIQSQQQRAAEANEYYYTQQRQDTDYARRIPKMQHIAAEFQHIIRPEYLNSIKALKAIDLMSRGSDMSYYEQQAVSKAQKDGLSVLQEKRHAQSESSGPSGKPDRAFATLSTEEMEAYLEQSDD